MRRAFHLLVIGIFVFPATLFAASPPAAAIASAHPLATEAGFEILDRGGNAFDAAVAVAAALAVVEPWSAGMGGGGFWLLHDAATGRSVMIDARETAPAAATRDMYLNEHGEVDREWATTGPSAAAIPGQAAAFVHLAEHYGRLPLTVSLAPAIRLAREGFAVDEEYRTMAGFGRERLARFREASRLFLHKGDIPPAGHRIVQKDLARTLTLLAEKGHAGFYEGSVARRLVRGVQAHGGIWTLDDLRDYRVVEREPLVGSHRGARIISAPPPSAGGVVMLQALNVLERFERKKDEPLSPHLLVEAWRRAYFDRARYLGDPDFVEMPLEHLLSKDYAAELAAGIDPDRATPSAALGEIAVPSQGDNTTHLSVLDQEGNRVAATLSINTSFGSGYVAEGTGVLLNNEMDDFSARPGAPNAYGLVGSDANAIAPGKRPLSSMTPTFVEWDGRVAILGTPGGSRIITMVMLGVLEALNGAPPEQWVSRPRFHHQYLPDQVQAEPAFLDTDAAKALRDKGHELVSTGRDYGNMHAILWDSRYQVVEAASDPRGVGSAGTRALDLKRQTAGVE